MLPAAADVATSLKPNEIEKLPDRWSPGVSARKANAAEWKDSWEYLWFEAITETLAQSGTKGIPGLITLMNRDECTYQWYPIVRLLRLAADGVEADAILEQVRQRLETLRLPFARHVVQEAEAWTPVDPRPLELLLTMADIEIPGSDGDTLAAHRNTLGFDQRAS